MHAHPYHISQHNCLCSGLFQLRCPENALSDLVSHYPESRDGLSEIKTRERAQTAVREWGVWEQMINKRTETLWFIAEGGGSRALTFMNLMSQFCSFLLSVLFHHFNHLSVSVPALVCLSIKANASSEGGEMINILRKQLSQTDRAAVVTSETRKTHRHKLKSSRAKQRTSAPRAELKFEGLKLY